MWQQRERKLLENVAIGNNTKAALVAAKDETAKLTAEYLALRQSGKSDIESLEVIQARTCRPNLRLDVYDADTGDVAELVRIYG